MPSQSPINTLLPEVQKKIPRSMARGNINLCFCWLTLLAMALLTQEVRSSNEGEGGGGTEEKEEKSDSTSSSTTVPDLHAVYTVSKSFPGYSDVACLTEGSPEDLTTSFVPPNLRNPTLRKNRWIQELRWRYSMPGPSARGGVCVSAPAPHYPVSFPLMSPRAPLVPEFLSYTISAGEDLRVRLRGAKLGGDVWWQKEPLEPGAWKQATLTDTDGALLLPAAVLSGSGFYTVRNDSDVNDTVSGAMGTFSLVIRDCPAQRYGDGCLGWCPDCMHGGVCHPRTGECVCPEGVAGKLCERRCEGGKGGRDCNLDVMIRPGRQLCRPSPVPCLCEPGYTGRRCLTECPSGKWGADCAQDCHLRCVGDCDGFTGECNAEGTSQCAGGDAGLPRLRQAPVVTEVGAEEATVEFSEWREDYDDGDASPWNSLTHVIRLQTVGEADNPSQDFTTSGPPYRLTGLTPATQYVVKVLVVGTGKDDEGLNLTCVADGTGRERVHNVTFTTTCPEEVPVPEITEIVKTSDTSILVRWKPVSYPAGCHLKYHLAVIPEGHGEVSAPLKTHYQTLLETQTEVTDLEADVQYTIRVVASSSANSSAPASSYLQIYHMSVGHAEVGGAVAVVVVLAVVIAVVLWRKGRRRRSKKSRTRQPENATDTPVPTEDDTHTLPPSTAVEEVGHLQSPSPPPALEMMEHRRGPLPPLPL